MKRNNVQAATWLLAAFVLWTVLVALVDVRPIGPCGTQVGFATVNGLFHQFTGVHMVLYGLTDWLSLVPVAIGLGFAVLGLSQWMRRKAIRKVDRSILAMGGFYLLVAGVYLLFEQVVVNYRPVLIQGVLEASYPSSTTVLVQCILPTARLQLTARMQNPKLQRGTWFAIAAFEVFMVTGRLLSGVHWLTDILGGMLLSRGLVRLYAAVAYGKENGCDGKIHIPTGKTGGDSIGF